MPSEEKELGRGVSGAAAAYLKQKRAINMHRKKGAKIVSEKHSNQGETFLRSFVRMESVCALIGEGGWGLLL